jgi:phage terminase small subunit
LTPKQALFVQEYATDCNATQAAIRAGYSVKTAYSLGQRLLKNAEVAASLSKHQERRLADLEITNERILREAAAIAFGTIENFITFTSDGEPRIDLSQATSEQRAVLAEVQVEDFTEGRGEDKRDVRRVKIKPYDKLRALEILMKHRGLLNEKMEHTFPDLAAMMAAARGRAGR